jgi:hypothetical protein
LDKQDSQNPVKKFISVFQYSGVALEIVWSTSAKLTIAMALTTLFAGVMPAAIASVGGLFVDVVSNAFQDDGSNTAQLRSEALYYVFLGGWPGSVDDRRTAYQHCLPNPYYGCY